MPDISEARWILHDNARVASETGCPGSSATLIFTYFSIWRNIRVGKVQKQWRDSGWGLYVCRMTDADVNDSMIRKLVPSLINVWIRWWFRPRINAFKELKINTLKYAKTFVSFIFWTWFVFWRTKIQQTTIGESKIPKKTLIEVRTVKKKNNKRTRDT